MNASLTTAFSLSAVMAATLVTVTPLRALLEVFAPADSRSHDALVQLLALLVGLFWAFVIVWATGPQARSDQVQIVITVLVGLGGGTASIGAHRMATTATRSPPSPPAPPPSPGPES